MTDDEINIIASRVLAGDPTRPGFLRSDTRSDTDFSGEPVIQVTAYYKNMPRPARPLDGMHAIRTELIKLGEERSVFLTNDYEDEPISIEEDAA